MARIRRPSDAEPIVRNTGEHKQPDERFIVQMRAEDRSFWFQLAYYQEKYKVLLIPITALLLLGARQWIKDTMHETTAGLSARIDTTQATILHEAASRDSINQKLTILLRVTCISSKATKSELALAGLNCSSFSSVQP